VQSKHGHSPESFSWSSGLAWVHPEDHGKAAGLLDEVLQGAGASRAGELRARRADGSWAWIELNLTNLMDDPTSGESCCWPTTSRSASPSSSSSRTGRRTTS
jgi:PAS domain-containing protein